MTNKIKMKIQGQKRILIVDDSRLNLKVLSDMLKTEYKIMAVNSGEQALKAVKKEHPPDLILLDVMMPDMDGFEVCRRLKADESSREIPVIFITGLEEATDEAKGLELGAMDYITKPISAPIVKARIRTQLVLKHNMDELKQAYQIIESQKSRMEDELNVGNEIQMSRLPMIFPPFPDRSEFSIFAKLDPAREVGGDFYDFFFVDESRLCICIGDAAGKGVPSALFMAETKVLIKSRAKDDASTASIITHVNDELSHNNETYMFITLFIGILDVKRGILLYTNAGHNPPYIIRGNGSLECLDNRHGPVVGAMEGLAYKEDLVTLGKSDLVFLYTDGVTEAKAPNDRFFSDARLAELLVSRNFQSVEDVVIMISNEVKKFEGHSDQSDDITILSVQLLEEPVKDQVRLLNITIQNRISELEIVKGEFNNFADEISLPTQVRQQMLVVLDEMLSNIISYAYEDFVQHIIELYLEVINDRLTIIISDDGMPFNPFNLAEPDTTLSLEDRTVGGLGIHLVRKAVDKYSYQRRIDKNVITLVKVVSET